MMGAEQKTSDERKAILAQAIQRELAQGKKRRVESRGDYDAVIVQAKSPDISTGIHILLTIITAGLWIIAWIIIAVVVKEKRFFVNVDEFGNGSVSEV